MIDAIQPSPVRAPLQTYSPGTRVLPRAHVYRLGFLIGLLNILAPADSLANTAFRTSVVAPSVYRQPFSQSQSSWGADILLQQGMRINPEDRLVSKGSGMATIICESGSYVFKKKSYTQVSSFCQAQRAAPTQALPGSQDASIPYLLQPRDTLVRGPEVMVRWNPVAGVSRYQLWLIRLRDRRLLWGAQVLKAAHTTLPANLNLEAGESYRLVVEADNGSSSQLEPSSAQLRFGILSRAEARELDQALADIESLRQQRINPQTVALLEAGALEQRGLLADAISLLERQERQLRSLEGQLQLGRLTSLQGLNQRAQDHFQQAASLARSAGVIDALREAQAGLELTSRLAGDSGRPSPP